MNAAGSYQFSFQDDSGLDPSQYAIRVLGYSVASQLMLGVTSGSLQWEPLPTSQTIAATLTNGSSEIALGGNLLAFTPISVGDLVSGNGIPEGTTVEAISANIILSQQAISTVESATADVTVMMMVGGTATQDSSVITGLVPPPSLSNLRVGQVVSGAGIADGTTLIQIDLAGNQITISQPATSGNSYSGSSPLIFLVQPQGSFAQGSTSATLTGLGSTDQVTQPNSGITQATALPSGTQISQLESITLTLSNTATLDGSSDLVFTSQQSSTLSAASQTISGVGSPNTLGVGRLVTGQGIPAGSTITSIAQNGQITISNAATASGTQSLIFPPATGVIPSFDIHHFTSFSFDTSVLTNGLNGARLYFFVVPNSWPAVATQPGFSGYPTNPPGFPYSYSATGFGINQPNNPPNSPSTTSSYSPFAIVEPTIDPETNGGNLHIDVQTVDGFTFPLSLTLQNSAGSQLGQVGQPVPSNGVTRAAIISAFHSTFLSGPYASLLYSSPSDIDDQFSGILNPGAYLANGANPSSTLNTIWNSVLNALFSEPTLLNMIGDDSNYYQGKPTTITINGNSYNVLQFVGYTDTAMTQANGNIFNIFSPLKPDPSAPNNAFTAGYQVFANDTVFNDASGNVIQAQNDKSNPNPTQVVLGLERDIVSALNRGIALLGPSGTEGRSAGDTSYYWAIETNWYPYAMDDADATHVQNLFSLFMHTGAVGQAAIFTQPDGAVKTPQGLVMGMAYGFAFDESPVHAAPDTPAQPTVPSKFDPVPDGTTTIIITLGPWS